jgi:hypothetical protein
VKKANERKGRRKVRNRDECLHFDYFVSSRRRVVFAIFATKSEREQRRDGARR